MRKARASCRMKASVRFFLSFLLLFTFHHVSREWNEDVPEVTFIIPSTGRPTLERTLASLTKLEGNFAWRAKIMFPRGSKTLPSRRIQRITADKRITAIEHDRQGLSNCAGRMRNVGVTQSSTPWVAFLDDDDTVSPNYLVHFVNERLAFPSAKLIVFRMFDARIAGEENVIPPAQTNQLSRNQVGISFIFKKTDTDLDYFVDSTTEDFDFLASFCNTVPGTCVLSRHVTYFVRMSPIHIESIGRSKLVEVATDSNTIFETLSSQLTCLPTEADVDISFLNLPPAEHAQNTRLSGLISGVREAMLLCPWKRLSERYEVVVLSLEQFISMRFEVKDVQKRLIVMIFDDLASPWKEGFDCHFADMLPTDTLIVSLTMRLDLLRKCRFRHLTVQLPPWALLPARSSIICGSKLPPSLFPTNETGFFSSVIFAAGDDVECARVKSTRVGAACYVVLRGDMNFSKLCERRVIVILRSAGDNFPLMMSIDLVFSGWIVVREETQRALYSDFYGHYLTSTLSETDFVVHQILENMETAESISARARAALRYRVSHRGQMFCDLLEQH